MATWQPSTAAKVVTTERNLHPTDLLLELVNTFACTNRGRELSERLKPVAGLRQHGRPDIPAAAFQRVSGLRELPHVSLFWDSGRRGSSLQIPLEPGDRTACALHAGFIGISWSRLAENCNGGAAKPALPILPADRPVQGGPKLVKDLTGRSFLRDWCLRVSLQKSPPASELLIFSPPPA